MTSQFETYFTLNGPRILTLRIMIFSRRGVEHCNFPFDSIAQRSQLSILNLYVTFMRKQMPALHNHYVLLVVRIISFKEHL
jgi:hypothetical protein